MLTLCYSGKSRPSALKIAHELNGDLSLNRGSQGDINWGRNRANTTLNPDISNVTNKRVMRQLFAEHDVPMPKLIPLEDVVLYLRTTGSPVVGRPDRHMKGRGFWLIDSVERLKRAVRGTRKKRAATHFMQFVEAPREYRVHIFKGKSIRISEKEFDENKNYVTVKPKHNIKHVRKAAKKAMEAVGLDFGAVDILANDTECWVLEVNAAPGLGGSMPELYARTFEQYFEGEWE
jgi:glutathione synthase/RimK-type ligase-like ATP-grasp enzyme